MNSTKLELQSPPNNQQANTFTNGISFIQLPFEIEALLEDPDSIKLLDQKYKKQNVLSIDNMKKLINFSTKMPIEDSITIGYKYPYNATKLLCSPNDKIQRLLLHQEEKEEEGKTINDSSSSSNEIDSNKLILRPRYDVVDHLFTFFDQNLNEQYYVLIGYFNKIFETVLELLGQSLIFYLFDDTPEVINHFIKNIQFKGIAECLEKILTYSLEDFDRDSNTETGNDNTISSQLLLHQQALYQMILNQMLNMNEEQIETICEILKNSFNSTSLYLLMLSSKDSIDTLFTVLQRSMSSPLNYRHVLSLLIELINQSKKLFSKQLMSQLAYQQQQENESKISNDNIRHFIIKLNETITNVIISLSSQTTNSIEYYSIRSLGLTKVTEAEYIKSTLDLILTSIANSQNEDRGIHLINTIINQKALMVLTYYSFEYPNNSIFISI